MLQIPPSIILSIGNNARHNYSMEQTLAVPSGRGTDLDPSAAPSYFDASEATTLFQMVPSLEE